MPSVMKLSHQTPQGERTFPIGLGMVMDCDMGPPRVDWSGDGIMRLAEPPAGDRDLVTTRFASPLHRLSRRSPTGALAEVGCLVAVGPWDGCGALQLRDDLTEVPAVVRHAVGGGGQRQQVPAAAAVLVGFVDEVAEGLSGRAVLSTTR